MPITLIENFRAVFYAPFYAASALGAFEAEGLDVEVTLSADAAQTMQTVMAGGAAVSWGGPLRLMLAREKHPEGDPIAFCEVVGRDPFFILGREPNPHFKYADLFGRTFARVIEVPTPWLCLQHDLRSRSLDWKALKLAPDRSMAENRDALRAGTVDLIQVFQPYAAELMRSGAAHVWYAAASRGPAAYTTLNTTRAYAQKHPQVILGMCRALYRTQKWIYEHGSRALGDAVSGYFPQLDRATLAASCDYYIELGLWNRTPMMQREGLEWLSDAAIAGGLLQTKFDYEEVAEMRFATQVIEEDPPPLAARR
jgi:NitT/TauT family transport system substrate-binding protein